MFRVEAKYLGENLTLCFEIAFRILREKAKATKKQEAQPNVQPDLGSTWPITPKQAI